MPSSLQALWNYSVLVQDKDEKCTKCFSNTVCFLEGWANSSPALGKDEGLRLLCVKTAWSKEVTVKYTEGLHALVGSVIPSGHLSERCVVKEFHSRAWTATSVEKRCSVRVRLGEVGSATLNGECLTGRASAWTMSHSLIKKSVTM